MKRISVVFCCLLSLVLQAASGLPMNMKPEPANSSSLLTPSIPRALDHGGKIETKYDGFNHETVVTLKKMRVTCDGAKGMQSTLNETCVSFAASLHCPGVQLDYVRYARVQLIFETKNWERRHPLQERELFVVANGERLKLGRMALLTQNVDTDRLVEVMKEVLEVSLPYQTFNKIALAEAVEMRVGKTTFALQKRNIAALRDLNNRVIF